MINKEQHDDLKRPDEILDENEDEESYVQNNFRGISRKKIRRLKKYKRRMSEAERIQEIPGDVRELWERCYGGRFKDGKQDDIQAYTELLLGDHIYRVLLSECSSVKDVSDFTGTYLEEVYRIKVEESDALALSGAMYSELVTHSDSFFYSETDRLLANHFLHRKYSDTSDEHAASFEEKLKEVPTESLSDSVRKDPAFQALKINKEQEKKKKQKLKVYLKRYLKLNDSEASYVISRLSEDIYQGEKNSVSISAAETLSAILKTKDIEEIKIYTDRFQEEKDWEEDIKIPSDYDFQDAESFYSRFDDPEEENTGGSGSFGRYYRNRPADDGNKTRKDEQDFEKDVYEPYSEESGAISFLVTDAGVYLNKDIRRFVYHKTAEVTDNDSLRMISTAYELSSGAFSLIVRNSVHAFEYYSRQGLTVKLIDRGILKADAEIKTRDDLYKAKARANRILKRNGFEPIKSKGYKSRREAAEILKENNDLSDEIVNALEAVILISDHEMLLDFGRSDNSFYKIIRYPRTQAVRFFYSNDLGYLVKAERILKNSLRGLIRTSQFAVQRNYIRNLKKMKEYYNRKLSELKEIKNEKERKEAEEELKRLKEKIDETEIKREEEKAAYRKLHDPFNMNDLKKKLKEYAKRRFVRKEAEKQAKKKTAELTVNKAAETGAGTAENGISSALKTVLASYSEILMPVLLVTGFLIISFVFGMLIVGLKTGAITENAKTECVLDEIKKCYQDDMDTVGGLASSYDIVNLTLKEERDSDVYKELNNTNTMSFSETTNAAEILSMVYAYYDGNLSSETNDDLIELTDDLYKKTHGMSIESRTVMEGHDSDDEEIIETIADVTYTTYYFDSCFDIIENGGSGFYISSLSGDSVAFEIWSFFRQNGFSEESTAALLGNIKQECDMDPTHDGDGSYGLFQFEKSTQEFDLLKRYAESKGGDYGDVLIQLNFMIDGGQMEKIFAYRSGKTGSYADTGAAWGWPEKVTVDEFKKMTDIDTATVLFEQVFEAARKPAMTNRKNYAHYYYNLYHGEDYESGDIVDEAMKYIGCPYVLGGNSLTGGIDCSHFVYQILKKTGHYSGEYVTSREWKNKGTDVGHISEVTNGDYSALKPGDVIVWQGNSYGHVAFYIGNGKIVHAANPKNGVKISQLSWEADLLPIIGIRRFS